MGMTWSIYYHHCLLMDEGETRGGRRRREPRNVTMERSDTKRLFLCLPCKRDVDDKRRDEMNEVIVELFTCLIEKCFRKFSLQHSPGFVDGKSLALAVARQFFMCVAHPPSCSSLQANSSSLDMLSHLHPRRCCHLPPPSPLSSSFN